jgi:hypothetical protein
MIRHKMQNEFSVPDENNASFGRRFFIYQKERFPLIGHGLLVSAFSFSATAYSRLCRGADGFIPWPSFLIGIFTTVSLFLLVRIFDEFKDAEDDAKYRKNLPVPRGLVSLKELGTVGACFNTITNYDQLHFPSKDVTDLLYHHCLPLFDG